MHNIIDWASVFAETPRTFTFEEVNAAFDPEQHPMTQCNPQHSAFLRTSWCMAIEDKFGKRAAQMFIAFGEAVDDDNFEQAAKLYMQIKKFKLK